MKKAFLSLLLACLAPAAIYAQQATVNGRIIGHTGAPFYAAHDRTIDTLTVDNKGEFTLKFDVPGEKSQVGFFGIGGASISLVASKGQTVNFVADVSAPGKETVTFTGDNAALNDYLTSYNLLTGFAAWPQDKTANAGSFNAYKAEVDKMAAELRRKLDKVEDGDVKKELRDALDLTQTSFYFRYAWATNRINGLPVDNDADFVKYAEGIDLDNRAVIGEERGQVTYTNLLDQRLRWEIERNPQKYPGPNSSVKYFAVISDLVSDPGVANSMATDNFDMYLTMGGDNNLMETLEAYKKVANDPETVAELEKKVRELDELGPGKMAPDFVIVDADGNKGMLSDLRGKNIYIDIWATWCGPCVMEIPYVEKLQEKYKDSENLEFISISVDDNVNAWKKKLEDDKPQWRNFVVEGGFRGPLNQLYYISGIPRFMLIDKDGRIVSVNAPRPSSAGIDEYLAPYM